MALSVDTTTSWDISSDATFRAWAQAIHDALGDVGLVQTADTGQINLASVTLPGAEGSGGYEIWRFDDAQQAGDPLFLRVEYHRGDTNTEARLHVTLGKGTNGAGTLSSVISATSVDGSQGALDSADRLIHVSLIDGSLVIIARADNAVATAYFVYLVERLQDDTGAFTGETVFITNGGSSTTGSRIWSGGAAATLTTMFANHNTSLPGGAIPVAEFRPVGRDAPLRCCVAVPDSAVNENDSGTMEHRGETVAMKAMETPAIMLEGAVTGTTMMAASSATSWRLCFRNE